jgi:hypothetical protein
VNESVSTRLTKRRSEVGGGGVGIVRMAGYEHAVDHRPPLIAQVPDRLKDIGLVGVKRTQVCTETHSARGIRRSAVPLTISTSCVWVSAEASSAA